MPTLVEQLREAAAKVAAQARATASGSSAAAREQVPSAESVAARWEAQKAAEAARLATVQGSSGGGVSKVLGFGLLAAGLYFGWRFWRGRGRRGRR